uniref:Disintegrin domain-containing protein n=2 Tax=Ascaris TaxID=6251 RepID=A0A0M3HPL9_ASCLU
MEIPYRDDEDFDRRGSYSPEEAAEPLKRLNSSMEGSRVASFKDSRLEPVRPARVRENTPSFWQRFLARVQAFKDFLSVHYCPFLDNISATVFLIIIIVIILALLAIIAIVVALAAASSKKQEPHSLLQMQRTHTNWPHVEGENPLSLKLVSSKALLPPNVSFCDGFGFSCTSLPSLVIGTLQRCDGVVDCPDGSDEVGCKVCQTVFSCNVASSRNKPAHLVCLRGSSISDGVKDCADNSDESRFRRKKCAEEEFRCHGTDVCLPSELLCDGDAHCRGGEDELQCEGKCRTGSRWCDLSKRCIPKWQICDGITNCADGTDEKNCSCRECSGNGKALCKNSKICLDRSRICDGIVDCPNGDDESQCPGSCPRPPSYIMDRDMLLCSDGRYYNRKYACSGLLKQCQDKCSNCDLEVAFTCKNNKCIPRASVCDGLNDCGDSSDEEDCGCAAMKKLGEVTQCGSASGNAVVKCIPASRRCDGYEDCPGGDDERNCDNCSGNPNAIYCNLTRTCYPSTKRCDGFEDCPNGIDEKDCTCEECGKQPYPMYMCSGSARCFPRSRVCSPFSRCPDATEIDKLFCANKARTSYFGL